MVLEVGLTIFVGGTIKITATHRANTGGASTYAMALVHIATVGGRLWRGWRAGQVRCQGTRGIGQPAGICRTKLYTRKMLCRISICTNMVGWGESVRKHRRLRTLTGSCSPRFISALAVLYTHTQRQARNLHGPDSAGGHLAAEAAPKRVLRCSALRRHRGVTGSAASACRRVANVVSSHLGVG